MIAADKERSVHRVAVVSMVRDEEDIIESFVRHHLRLVDAIYIAEHHSTDRTLQILRSLVSEGLPLVVNQIAGMAQKQAEYVTALMKRAFADGYSIVFALDADEFIVPDAAVTGIPEVRRMLHELDDSQVHSLRWVTYQTPGWCTDKFILRGARREHHAVADLQKVMVGRSAWQKTGLTIAQGNHICLVDGKQRPVVLPMRTIPDVHIAHFSWRSESQMAAKAVSGWLTNVAKYSRHTRMANQWHEVFHELAETGHVHMPRLAEPTQAMFQHDWLNLGLRYTQANRGQGLRRILLTAEAIADESARHEALRKGTVLTLIMLCAGDLTALSRTLSSVERLSYPELQFVVAVVPEALSGASCDEQKLTRLLEEQPDDMAIYLAEADDAAGLARELEEIVQGDIVQYLLPGDELERDRWESMATVLLTQPEPSFVFANAKREDEKRYLHIDPQGQSLLLGDGTAMLSGCEQMQRWPSTRLSDIMFRRSVLEEAGWLIPCMQRERFEESEMWRMILPGNVAALWS